MNYLEITMFGRMFAVLALDWNWSWYIISKLHDHITAILKPFAIPQFFICLGGLCQHGVTLAWY